ncbi:helix-turn-helix domain-containing protein [Halochromatium roseum]|uniref:helix-turn-helix domain-containing protein n=1 Tax=Halochromatium roseum TaxID=391920 RepID=UPI003084015A
MSSSALNCWRGIACFRSSGYNVTAAARALGTTWETLRYRIQKYGLVDVSAASVMTGR